MENIGHLCVCDTEDIAGSGGHAWLHPDLLQDLTGEHRSVLGSQRGGPKFLHPQYPTTGFRQKHESKGTIKSTLNYMRIKLIRFHCTTLSFLLYSVDTVTAIVVLIAWRREALKEEALDDLPWKNEREPSSIRRTLEPFQRQCWGNF